MGRKVHPIGFRLGYIKDWQSKWFADRTYTDQLHEDIMLRGAITRERPNPNCIGSSRTHLATRC